jgi:phage gp36-like protein
MAYATTAAMIARFGEAEMIRISAPEGELDGVVDATAVAVALDDASSLVDSYLEDRFVLPLSPVPAAIAAATCAIARHALGQARNQTPGEMVTKARDEAIAWLGKLAAGDAGLAGATVKAADARVQDRPRITWPETRGTY